MIKDLIRKLKKNKRLKSAWHDIKALPRFPARFVNREPSLIFYSPRVALARARGRQPLIGHSEITRLVEQKGIEGISIYEDVLSYPLEPGKEKEYAGGLINIQPLSLIPEAIQFNGENYCQEFPDEFTPASMPGNIPVITGTVLFGGILFDNFGHFLLESIGRLWGYEYVKEADPFIFFYVYGPPQDYLAKENFVHQVLSGFGIPVKKILLANKLVKLKQVIIPIQRYGYEYCKHPDDVFLRFVNDFKFPVNIPAEFEDADRVYVSRTQMPVGSGKAVGEIIFEEYLALQGYKPFHPQNHNIYQQLTVYSRARQIIFCDGGALHACILLPNIKADIAVISRRKDYRWDSRGILDQFDGYGKFVLWIDAVKAQYQFGFETWYATSIVDWFEVSKVLKTKGYVDEVIDKAKSDTSNLVGPELKRYVKKIIDHPLFMEYLTNQQEYK